jgi:plasmid stabilization system protein ParE
MVEKLYQVVWTNRSQIQMKQAFHHISKESPQNAGKVIEAIIIAVQKAIPNPEIYGPDKYKIDNDGSYRALEVHRYRVSYRFSNTMIRVLRVRHTSMEPKPY